MIAHGATGVPLLNKHEKGLFNSPRRAVAGQPRTGDRDAPGKQLSQSHICLPAPAPPPRPHSCSLVRPPSPVPEALPILLVILHGRGPPAGPAAASHDPGPVVRIALQVPGHRELLASHLVVGLAEIAVVLMQGAELGDGVVICRDKTRHDRAFYVLGRELCEWLWGNCLRKA